MTIQFCNFSCTIAAAPRRAIAKPLLHSAAFHHRHVRLRHAFSLAICSYHTTTTTHYAASAHIAAAAATNRTHLPITTSIGISLYTTTTLSGSTYHAYSNSYCAVLRHSLSLDDCATISATTTAHTPHPSFSIYSTSPFLHVATTTSHTTYRTYHRYADPVTSSTTTSNSSSSSTHRPAVDYAPGSLATLLSISPACHRHPQKTPNTHLHLPQPHNLLQPVGESSHHHHHPTSRQTGTHGMATLIVALLNSKVILDSVPTGCLLLAELASPSSSAKPAGKNSKTCNIYKINNSPPNHHKQIHNNTNLPPHPLPPHQQLHHHHPHNRTSLLLPRQHHRHHQPDHLQLMCRRCRLLSERPLRPGIRRNLQARLLAAISCDLFHPPAFSPACHRINPLTCSDKLIHHPFVFTILFATWNFQFFTFPRLTLAPQLFVRHFVLYSCTCLHGQSSRSPCQHSKHRILPATAPPELAPTFHLH